MKKVIINEKEYILCDLNTTIYVDLLYLIKYLDEQEYALYAEAQMELIVDATGISEDEVRNLHPSEFFKLAEEVQEYYNNNSFFNVENEPDKKFKIVKIDKNKK